MLTRRPLRFYIAVLLPLLAVFVGTLHFLGRPWWSDAGPDWWVGSIWSHQTSQHLADPYSFTHVLHGILFFALLHAVAPRIPFGWKWLAAVVLEMLWEIAENSPVIIDRYRTATAALDYYGDSILNSLGDVLAAALGVGMAATLRWKHTLWFVVATEVLLALFIRDNLTLNLLMLLWPIDAVKTWQLQAAGI